MKRVLTRYWTSIIAAVVVVMLSSSASATTVRTPADDEMIIGARAIVIANVVAVSTSLDESRNRVCTYTTLRVQEVLKGQITDKKIVLKEEGGDLGYRGTVVYGTPRYTVGEKVLVYLNTWSDGSLRTHQMFLGKFNIVRDPETGKKTVVRSIPDSEVVYLKGEAQSQQQGGVATERMELSAYKEMLRTRLAANFDRDQEYSQKYYSRLPMNSKPAEFDSKVTRGEFQPQYTFITNPPVRWFEPDSGQPVMFAVNPDGAPAGGLTDLDAAMNAWSTVANCSLRVQRAALTTESCVSGGGQNVIIFSGCDGRWGSGPTCSGILALGGLNWSFETTVINGVTFRRAQDGFVSFNPWCPNSPCGVSGDVTTQMVATHEMGHALGLGHSWQPSFGGSPTATQFDAIMYYIAKFNICAELHADDIAGITFMYPGSGGGGGGGALSISTTSLAAGTTGVSYSQTLAATGGTPPYAWSVPGGGLPTGLSISAAGVISGIPSATGTFNFWVQVDDSASGSAQKALSIVVSSPGTGYNSQFVSQSVPSTVSPGQQFNATFSWLNNGTATWNGSSGFVIRSQNPAGNTTWGGNQVNLTGFTWAPGQTMSIQVTFIAPSTAGNYNFQWQLYQNGVGYFGQASTNVSMQVGSGGGGGGGVDGATFSSQSVPTTMTAGQSYMVSVTMQNSGTTTWSAGTYKLGSQNPQDSMTWGLNRVNLVSSVAPGATGTFTFNVTAPPNGTYNFQWQMFNGTAFFGAVSTNVTVVVSAGGGGGGGGPWDAAFVSQSVPQTMTPGQNYSVAVTMKNTGTQSWSSASGIVLSVVPFGSSTWNTTQVSLTKFVGSGSTFSFTFSVRAPSTSGTYPFQWQVRMPSGYIGQPSTAVQVQVGSGGGGGGTDNASFVSQNVPSSMAAGQSVAVSVTMNNNGSTTWQPGVYVLGSLNPAGNMTWGLSQVSLGSSVAPGSSATFNFNVTAPSTPGSYNFQWGMKNGGTYFGAASTNVVVSVTSAGGGGTDNAQFASQNVPASMTTGQVASVSVTMSNNGSTTWAPGSYTLVSRNPAGNMIWGLSSVALGSSVAPGGSATFNFSITAPSTAGTYNFQWQMAQSSAGFGAMSTNVAVSVTSSTVLPLVLTTTTLPNGTLNVTYSQQLAATGGVTPYTWTVTTGAIPAGLTLNSSTGLLSGKPTKASTESFTITVRDSSGTTASRAFKVQIR